MALTETQQARLEAATTIAAALATIATTVQTPEGWPADRQTPREMAVRLAGCFAERVTADYLKEPREMLEAVGKLTGVVCYVSTGTDAGIVMQARTLHGGMLAHCESAEAALGASVLEGLRVYWAGRRGTVGRVLDVPA